jgi:beta-phosphoglucomutase
MTQTGVIFDMDGVLVDSGPDHAASWRAVASQHNIEISDEQFKRTFGRPSRDIIRIIWGEQVSDEEIERYDQEKEAKYRELIAGRIPLMPGARRMLADLRQAELVLALATSGPRENVELVLRESNLGSFFAAVVTGFDIKKGKPAPDCFLLAAERANLTSAGCVVVEDAPVGIEAAVAAGMIPIGLVGTHPAQRLQAAGAALVAEELSEVTPTAVADLLQRK